MYSLKQYFIIARAESPKLFHFFKMDLSLFLSF